MSEVQAIASKNTKKWEYYNIDQRHFLISTGKETTSILYEYDATKTNDLFQQIHSFPIKSEASEHIQLGDKHFLAIANFGAGTIKIHDRTTVSFTFTKTQNSIATHTLTFPGAATIPQQLTLKSCTNSGCSSISTDANTCTSVGCTSGSYKSALCTISTGKTTQKGWMCTPYGGSCSNGVLIPQSSRTSENHCETCENGYHISNGPLAAQPITTYCNPPFTEGSARHCPVEFQNIMLCPKYLNSQNKGAGCYNEKVEKNDALNNKCKGPEDSWCGFHESSC